VSASSSSGNGSGSESGSGFATHDPRRWTGRNGERNPQGSNHRNAKINEDQAREIKNAPRWGPGAVSNADLAARYGISPRTVRGIRDGVTWRHVVADGPGELDLETEEL
jgi:hypothetical protein